jgi:hypothetical protein
MKIHRGVEMMTNPMASVLEDDDAPPVYPPRTGPRVVICEITGHPVVESRPGVPLVTDEEIKRLLEDFP